VALCVIQLKTKKKMTNDWTTDQYILKCSKNQTTELKQYIESEKKTLEECSKSSYSRIQRK